MGRVGGARQQPGEVMGMNATAAAAAAAAAAKQGLLQSSQG
jgi:hypothetical protein